MDPAVQSYLYKLYSFLYEECPVYKMPETGFYVVTKYDGLRKILKDTEVFSNSSMVRQGLHGENYKLQQSILTE